MSIKKTPASSRAMRLECLRIAANVVSQLKDNKISVVDTAKAFHAFVEGDQAEDDPADDDDVRAFDEPAAAANGRYSLRDLRRGR